MKKSTVGSLERVLIDNDEHESFPDTNRTEGTTGCCSSPKCQLLLLSAAFFSVFTGFNGGQNLESSLDMGDVDGAVTVGIIYGVFTFTCFLSPSIVKWLSPKTAILWDFVICLLFLSSNIYPRVWDMYLTSALLGFGAGPCWVAQGEFVSTLAERHHTLYEEEVYGLFNGIFYTIFQSTQVFGNVISAVVLTSASDSTPTFDPTFLEWFNQFSESKKQYTIPDSTRNLIFWSYAACCGIGFFILLLCVNRLKHEDQLRKSTSWELSRNTSFQSVGQTIGTNPNIFATFRLMTRPKMFLLIPLFLANGLEMGFSWSSLTGDVITPFLGKENLGWCMTVFGACNAVSSLFFGTISDHVGTTVCISFSFVVLIGILSYLYWYVEIWQPQSTYIFIACGLWGLCDGIIQPMISVILGKEFRSDRDSAFTTWRLWQSMGISIIFLCQNSVKLKTKILIVAASWVIGMVALLIAKRADPLNRKEFILSVNTSDYSNHSPSEAK